MGLDRAALNALIESLQSDKNYQKSGKAYLKGVSELFKNADIPLDDLKTVLADIKKYADIDVVATSTISKDGVGTIAEEGKLLNKIVKGLQKVQDILYEEDIGFDETYIEDGEIRSYEDTFTIVNSMLSYFEPLKYGELVDDLDERAKLEAAKAKGVTVEVAGYHIDATKQSFETVDWDDREIAVKDVPLFAHDPSPSDIAQQQIGDCYLLAGLSEIALKNPQAIKEAMRENKDGTVTVRFWQRVENTSSVDAPDSFRPVYVTVDKVTPKSGSSKDCCWVQMMERAYVASGLHKHRGFSSRYNSPTPHNLKEMYEKYKKMSPEDRPTHQECPWLFDKEGNLLEPRPSYKSIEGGHPGNFVASLLGEKFESNTLRMNQYITPQKDIDTVKSEVFAEIARKLGIENVPDNAFAEHFLKYSTLIAHRLIHGKDADYAHLLDAQGNLLPDDSESPMSPSTLFQSLYNMMFSLSGNMNLAKLDERMGTKLDVVRDSLNPALSDEEKASLNKMHGFLKRNLGYIKRQCLGDSLTGTYSAKSEELYNKLDDLTRVKGYTVTCGTYGISDRDSTDGIFHKHAYSVINVDEQKVGSKTMKFVNVRNPHGKTGRKYEEGPDHKIKRSNDENCKDGVFRVELNDFVKEFDIVDYNAPITGYHHVAKDQYVSSGEASKMNRVAKNLLKSLEDTDFALSKDSDAYKNLKNETEKLVEYTNDIAGTSYADFQSKVAWLHEVAGTYHRHLLGDPMERVLTSALPEPDPKKLSSRQQRRYEVVKSINELFTLSRDPVNSKDPKAALMDQVVVKYAKEFIRQSTDDKYRQLAESMDSSPKLRKVICDKFKESKVYQKTFKDMGFHALRQMYDVPSKKVIPFIQSVLDEARTAQLPQADAPQVNGPQVNHPQAEAPQVNGPQVNAPQQNVVVAGPAGPV